MYSVLVGMSLKVSESYYQFFSELWNWLDLFGCISLLIHCIASLFDEGLTLYVYYSWSVLVAAFCFLLRGVSRISPFSTDIRLLLGVFIQTFRDIYSFLVLFAYMIFSMSVLHVVVKRTDDDYDKNIDNIGISHSLRETYR